MGTNTETCIAYLNRICGGGLGQGQGLYEQARSQARGWRGPKFLWGRGLKISGGQMCTKVLRQWQDEILGGQKFPEGFPLAQLITGLCMSRACRQLQSYIPITLRSDKSIILKHLFVLTVDLK